MALNPHTGRIQAQRLFPVMRSCERCGQGAKDRHHRDDNTLNNDPINVAFLCRRCHMETDGRLATFQAQAIARIAGTTEAAAVARRSRKKCKRGHELAGENLYVKPNGNRVCRACRLLLKEKQ